MSATVPTLAEAAARLKADESDAVFVSCYSAAIAKQGEDCDVSMYTETLREAAFRRVANLWASRAHTLGVLDTGSDYGLQYVPRYDPVLDDLERPYRHAPTVLA